MSAPLENILKRDRYIVLSGIAAITLLAWWYMAIEARAMMATGICECFGLKMTGPDMTEWGPLELAALGLMWTEMMIAMMVPTAAPMLLTFATVNRQRQASGGPFVPTTLFLLGYIGVWTVFSIAAALAQWLLHREALISPMMVSTSTALGAVILIGAGLFQWSPWKQSCLASCRSPLAFLMTQWREGRRGALVMGFRHGIYCTGCCWLLMALLFVAGVMNLLWIAVISALVLAEKIVGAQLSRFTGLLLVCWGIWVWINPR